MKITTIVPELQKSYGNYVNISKMIPSLIDGVIPVQKRILLTLYDIARTQFHKTASVLGTCMAKYHPHSEALGTAEWAVHNNFADGQGQWGIKYSSETASCAAARYTSIKLSDFMYETAFKYIKYTDWVSEEMQPEPVNLTTMFPLCLIGNYEYIGIGYSFKTQIPTYHISDLVKRLMYLLKKTKNEHIFAPKSNVCKFRKCTELFKQLLEKGDGKLEISGISKNDLENYRINIQGWSPRLKFETVLTRINKFKDYNLLENGDVVYTDLSSSSTNILFEVNRSRNKKEIYNKLKKSIDFALSALISYKIYTIKDKQINETSVDEMLLAAYENYSKSFKNYLSAQIKNCTNLLTELEKLSKIKVEIIEEKGKLLNMPFDELITLLSDRTSIIEEDISVVLKKYNIKSLIESKLNISEVKNKIKDLNKQMNNREKIIIDTYKELGD